MVFGGYAQGPNILPGRTLLWNGNSATAWTGNTRNVPGGRRAHAMAYDSSRSRVVLFGGDTWDNTGVTVRLNETWEWDGTSWTSKTPASAPTARSFPAMAYDRVRAKVVLFGGTSTGSGVLGDTWEWDGTTWTQRSPATVPTSRTKAAMAYDSARQRVVLFGGRNAASALLGDTWEFDGMLFLCAALLARRRKSS